MYRAVTDAKELVQPYCPICQSARIVYLFISQGYPICQCLDCTMLFRNPLPPADVLQQVYTESAFLGEQSDEGQARVAAMQAATARLSLARLLAYTSGVKGRLLEVGCGTGAFLLEAQQEGFTVTGLEVSPHGAATANTKLGSEVVLCGTLETQELPWQTFDVCVLSDVLEYVRDPLATLQRVYTLLKPGGVILVLTPSVESWSAKLFRRNWREFKLAYLTFFSPATIENALAKAGFAEIAIKPNQKVLTPEYIYYRLAHCKVPAFSRLVSFGHTLLPNRLRRWQLKVAASGILALARTTVRQSSRRSVSIIVPAYNEQKTFATVMEALLDKDLGELDKEIIVVESNSTDGTRNEVLRYQDTPKVKVILEPAPGGKGQAVRTGLAHASGDFIIIQDADLEYDLNDYDALLAPLQRYQYAFVLGSRYGRGWKIRKFTDSPWQAVLLNLGHIFFTLLLNVLYQQRLKDPYTMFKVFRRDCLYGIDFECKGFDFDNELIAKLLRKGYQPVEIPVNYTSRSFAEGKKIRPFRDPPTWIRALVKYRFAPIGRRKRV
ncbi:MAG TPA: glycosyltransferase [Candidatus Tectomicrobia bacterium]